MSNETNKRNKKLYHLSIVPAALTQEFQISDRAIVMLIKKTIAGNSNEHLTLFKMLLSCMIQLITTFTNVKDEIIKYFASEVIWMPYYGGIVNHIEGRQIFLAQLYDRFINEFATTKWLKYVFSSASFLSDFSIIYYIYEFLFLQRLSAQFHVCSR